MTLIQPQSLDWKILDILYIWLSALLTCPVVWPICLVEPVVEDTDPLSSPRASWASAAPLRTLAAPLMALAAPLMASEVTSATGEMRPGWRLAEGDFSGLCSSSLVFSSVFPFELISKVFPSPLLLRMTGIPPDMRQSKINKKERQKTFCLHLFSAWTSLRKVYTNGFSGDPYLVFLETINYYRLRGQTLITLWLKRRNSLNHFEIFQTDFIEQEWYQNCYHRLFN